MNWSDQDRDLRGGRVTYSRGREGGREVSLDVDTIDTGRGGNQQVKLASRKKRYGGQGENVKLAGLEGWRVSSVRSLNGLWASLSGLPSRTDLTYLSLYILLRFLSSGSAIIRGIIYFFFEKILFSFRDYSI